MKSQGKETHTESGSSETKDEATDLVIEPAFDQEAIAVLAYFYWRAAVRMIHLTRIGSGQKQTFAAGSLPPQPPEGASMGTEPR